MREAMGADAGDVVTLEIAPAGEEPEPKVPADLRKALAAAPKARTTAILASPLLSHRRPSSNPRESADDRRERDA